MVNWFLGAGVCLVCALVGLYLHSVEIFFLECVFGLMIYVPMGIFKGIN